MADQDTKAEPASQPKPSAEGPADPERRKTLIRLGSTLAIAGAAGVTTAVLYDGENPVRERSDADSEVSDHRVTVAASVPKMVIARGSDPAKNVDAALKRMGGMALFVSKGDRVLIKPNVGWNRRPEQAANTNPLVVAALVRACREAGAREILVTDCPVNNAERCFSRSGILDAAQQAGARVILPERSRHVMVRIPGKLGRWPVLEPFANVDKVINAPVAKHHSLTHATVGMKNWYGILGGQRNRLHQRIDDSIAELATLMRPTLTVVDATRILLRNGPTGGSLADVKRVDTIAVSLDPVAVDAWGVELVGADPNQMGWLGRAVDNRLGVVDYRSLNPIEIKAG